MMIENNHSNKRKNISGSDKYLASFLKVFLEEYGKYNLIYFEKNRDNISILEYNKYIINAINKLKIKHSNSDFNIGLSYNTYNGDRKIYNQLSVFVKKEDKILNEKIQYLTKYKLGTTDIIETKVYYIYIWKIKTISEYDWDNFQNEIYHILDVEYINHDFLDLYKFNIKGVYHKNQYDGLELLNKLKMIDLNNIDIMDNIDFTNLEEDLELLLYDLNPTKSDSGYYSIDCPICRRRQKAYIYFQYRDSDIKNGNYSHKEIKS